MTTLTRQEVTVEIAKLTNEAREAISKAEALATEHGVSFSFEIDDAYGTYYTGEYANGTKYGYWDGWQGSSC